MEQQFKLQSVVQDLKMKKYLEFLTKQCQNPSVIRLESLQPGDEVSFQLETGKEAVLSYVGQKPEKVVVEEGNTKKLRVVIPDKDCILVFRTEDAAREVEIAYSLK